VEVRGQDETSNTVKGTPSVARYVRTKKLHLKPVDEDVFSRLKVSALM